MVVTIPPTHVITQLERPTRLPPDPRTEFTVVDPVVYSADTAFISEVRRDLATWPAGQRRILFFIHGYNNTASDAVLRMAQFVEDTGFEGVPVLLTWASAASTSRYVYDLNSALVARSKLKEITDILERTGAESVDVFAHSMGAFLTMEGLVDGAQAGRIERRASRINHIVLASPDIDLDLFRTQLVQLPPSIREKMFLLVSTNDGALRASRLIAGGVPRLELHIEHRAVGDLIPYARNARTHSEAQVALIAGSIREYGFTNPVLVDGENGIIAGHGRVMTALPLAGRLMLWNVACRLVALGHVLSGRTVLPSVLSVGSAAGRRSR